MKDEDIQRVDCFEKITTEVYVPYTIDLGLHSGLGGTTVRNFRPQKSLPRGTHTSRILGTRQKPQYRQSAYFEPAAYP